MRALFIVIAILGIVLTIYSHTMPMYTNKAEKYELDRQAGEHIGENDWAEFKEEYFEQVGTLRTHRHIIMDFGFGVTSFSLSALLFFLIFRIRQFKDLLHIRTPKKKMWIFVIGNLAWLALLPGIAFYFFYRLERGDYPWFADSIAIPVVTGAGVIIILLPFINVFFGLFASQGTYPAKIFVKYATISFSSVFFEILFLLLGTLNIIILLGFVLSGDVIGIPVAVVYLYLLLSLRAGKIQRTNKA